MIDPLHVVKNYSHGQLLVAELGETPPPPIACASWRRNITCFWTRFWPPSTPAEKGRVVAIIPLGGGKLPDLPVLYSTDELKQHFLPACTGILLRER